jgi:hypothetical protein
MVEIDLSTAIGNTNQRIDGRSVTIKRAQYAEEVQIKTYMIRQSCLFEER